jgi:hypothetical protein
VDIQRRQQRTNSVNCFVLTTRTAYWMVVYFVEGNREKVSAYDIATNIAIDPSFGTLLVL